jgi:hypothetical protein
MVGILRGPGSFCELLLTLQSRPNWSAISRLIHPAIPWRAPSKACFPRGRASWLGRLERGFEGGQTADGWPACLERSKYQEEKCKKQVCAVRCRRGRVWWLAELTACGTSDQRAVSLLQRVLQASRNQRQHAQLPETIDAEVSRLGQLSSIVLAC